MIAELLEKAKKELKKAEKAVTEHRATAEYCEKAGSASARIHREAESFYRDRAKQLKEEIEYVSKRLRDDWTLVP